MAVQVIMPRVGISVESCIVTQWHKQKGERVRAGDVLFSYETDKATADEEAKTDGVLLEIYAGEGDEVPVLQTVCVLGEPGEIWDQGSGNRNQGSGNRDQETTGAASAQEDTPVTEQPIAAPLTPNASLLTPISPRAKQLARKTGVDTQNIPGTGPGGRVIERDVRAVRGQGLGIRDQGSGGRDQGGEVVRLSNVRKVIAKAMVQSLASMAQLTNHHSFDATAILDYRAKLKAQGDSILAGVTLGDMLLYAVAQTLPKHRDLNAHLIGEDMHYFSGVHLGIAVDTPRGLLVPTLFDADKLSLATLSGAAKKLIAEAKAGTIAPDVLQGGTFTVTNLGTLGVEQFTPVINPPQTGILGVCAIVDRVRTIDRGIAAYPAMGLSLTYDHRAVDGAPAAKFVMELKEYLENWNDDRAF